MRTNAKQGQIERALVAYIRGGFAFPLDGEQLADWGALYEILHSGQLHELIKVYHSPLSLEVGV